LYKHDTEKLALFLNNNSISACPYHSELEKQEKSKSQDSFMKGKIRVIVATVAFGMGIDKHNIRGIIHLHMPRTVENYLQEIGRGGRDGNLCRCHLILSDENYLKLRSYICGTETVDFISLKYIINMLFKNAS